MPLVHIVLVKVKADIKAGNGLADFEQQCHALGEDADVKALATEMKWAPSAYDARTRGYDWGLYSVFSDKATYEKYRDHPTHRTFVNKTILPNTDDLLAYDFEI